MLAEALGVLGQALLLQAAALEVVLTEAGTQVLLALLTQAAAEVAAGEEILAIPLARPMAAVLVARVLLLFLIKVLRKEAAVEL